MRKVFEIKNFNGEVVGEFIALDFLLYAKSSIEESVEKKRLLGLCKIYTSFLEEKGYEYPSVYSSPLIDVIPKLSEYKDNDYPRMFWWPFTDEGMKERLKVVNELIEKYESEENKK